MAVTSSQNPLFRKVILPWYDTDFACVLTGFIMALILAFSLTGICVAIETPENYRCIWVPCLLLVLSAAVIVSICVRLFRRYAQRFKKEYP